MYIPHVSQLCHMFDIFALMNMSRSKVMKHIPTQGTQVCYHLLLLSFTYFHLFLLS
jgi:hypothetical protein